MKDKITPKIKRTFKKSVDMFEGILPFTEKPSNDHFAEREEVGEKNDIKASDLFSIFTADIIKKEVVFTR
jgi:hypothetical protein